MRIEEQEFMGKVFKKKVLGNYLLISLRSKIIEQVQHIFICNPKLQNTFRNSEENPPSIFIKRMLSFLLKKNLTQNLF